MDRYYFRNSTAHLLSSILMFAILLGCSKTKEQPSAKAEKLFVVTHLTEPGSFTSGAEGPAVSPDGILYAVNYARQQTIGRVEPSGKSSIFVELPGKSIGNGIRFNSNGDMFIADYVNHNILRVDMDTQEISVFAHDDRMNQPNDITISSKDIIYASDPDWSNEKGQLWMTDTQGNTTLLEENMGTTNGVEVSPGDEKLYVNESAQRNIWVYDLAEDGTPQNKRLFYQFEDFGMDGMRCDVDGNLYVTRHGKGTIVLLTPEAELIREIPVKAGKSTTNLAFGGPDGRQVYITVADEGNIQTFKTDKPGRSWQLYRQHGLLE